MKRLPLYCLASLVFILFSLGITSSPPALAQEWKYRVKPRGILKVVDFWFPSLSIMHNYAEGLVMQDRDNNYVPCLAEDLRWIDDRTIEFKLRKGVTFHNGEEFNAEALRINWEAYRKMESPRPNRHSVLSDETVLQIIDQHIVRFTFPEPEGLALFKFSWFFQFAPAFFRENKFDERNYGYLPEPGPWGTGPFKLVEGSVPYARPTDRIVMEANEEYWDPGLPKVRKVIFDNTLIGDRDKAMRLCREMEGAVDIVNHIRPLDTLKVAQSPFAMVVKSRDIAFLYGFLNQRKKDSKWIDIRLRKAINYAINRKELWKYAAKGNAFNLGGFIPPGAYGHNPDLALYTYDTDKARSLLAEAGYPNGFELEMITDEAWKLEAQIIGKMLERIGLTVELNVLTLSEFLRKIYLPILDKPPEEQEWDLGIWYAPEFSGHTGVSFLASYTDAWDYRWIQYDLVYEEMWKKMTRTVDPEAQEERIRDMVKYVWGNAYSVVIYSPISLYAVNKEVNFVPQKSTWIRLKETSVTDNHWSLRGQSE